MQSSLRLFFQLVLHVFPIPILRIVAGKILDIGVTPENQQVIYHLIHKVTVVGNDDSASAW